jgi:hypothetical protein
MLVQPETSTRTSTNWKETKVLLDEDTTCIATCLSIAESFSLPDVTRIASFTRISYTSRRNNTI